MQSFKWNPIINKIKKKLLRLAIKKIDHRLEKQKENIPEFRPPKVVYVDLQSFTNSNPTVINDKIYPALVINIFKILSLNCNHFLTLYENRA